MAAADLPETVVLKQLRFFLARHLLLRFVYFSNPVLHAISVQFEYSQPHTVRCKTKAFLFYIEKANTYFYF